MRILRFKTETKTGCGIFEEGIIQEVEHAAPDCMPGGLPFDYRRPAFTGTCYQPDAVTLLAPCRPSKIVAVGLNYRSHAEEIRMPLPDQPLLFLKPSTAVLDPGAASVRPAGYQRVDYEGELAVVFGQRARRVPASASGARSWPATVRLASAVGIANVVRTAQEVGIKSELQPYLPLALGASDVTLLELTQAYAIFATGKRMELIPYERMENGDKIVVEENLPKQGDVLDEKIA